jgi:hypothetical protein
MLRQRLRRRHAFFCDYAFERREPMVVVVVGFACVGIAGRLRLLDLLAKHGGPFAPGEQSFFVQRQRHGKRMGRKKMYRGSFPNLRSHDVNAGSVAKLR